MFEEALLVTSSTDGSMLMVHAGAGAGAGAGSALCPAYKHCNTLSNGITTMTGSSSYSGRGSTDYIVAAQAGKPLLHLYTPSSPSPALQIHTQEAVTALTGGMQGGTGRYLYSGSRTGRVGVWNCLSGALVALVPAHFRAVTCLAADPTGIFLFR